MSSERRRPFPFDQFEPKWQAEWDAKKAFRTANPGDADFDGSKPKFYVLDMFPYPSGAGLHVGHPEGYTATDIIGRYKRMNGHNVLHPMGWDAFGLPAEQYAIKTGQHPRTTTEHNVESFRGQLKRLGFAYDWDREVNTTDPGYFKWTQWIFLKLYGCYFDEATQKARPVSELEAQGVSRDEIDARRLAFVSEAPVNWCPQLGTVLANEEVVDGKSEVGGFPVERRPLRQWMLRITSYAQRLIDELDGLDWPDGIKMLQRNWIGRSEGALVDFQIEGSEKVTVFTTRPDTLFGATYMVLSPEHPLVESITTAAQKEAVAAYQKTVASKSDLERTELAKEKTGIFTGAYAINPVNSERIPVWIADYVLMGYGTGAIMAVPAHDERDFEFAQVFGLPIIQVVQPPEGKAWQNYCDDGHAVNSGFLDGLPTSEAKTKIIAWLAEKGCGEKKINFKLRDWLFSRQRYWGEPFPIVWEADGHHHAIPESELPLLPPDLADFKPTGTPEPPLSKATDWVQYSATATRELNTMPQWAGSCWYYLRYCDAQNSERFVGREAESYWMGQWRAGTGERLYDQATWHSLVESMVHRAVDEKSKRPPFVLPYAKVSEGFASQASKSGEDVSAFTHTLDVYSVRHAINEHGSAIAEAKQGQVAISEADFELLPEVLGNPDSIEFVAPHPGGLKRFVTQKRINGTIYVVEEMRGKRRHLNLITLYKKKAAGDVTPKAPPPHTSETNRSDDTTVATPAVKPGGVDLYVGGTEHAVLHLLYARFWHKVLYDLGEVSTPEPFQRLVNQGLILGEMEYTAFRDGAGALVSAKDLKDVREESVDGKVKLVATHKQTGQMAIGERVDEDQTTKVGAHFVLADQQDIAVDARSFKMSKSRGNVVNPDTVIQQYGADCLRLYEMFMGPLEQVKPWSMNGVEGQSRFLARVWRLVMESNQEGEWSQSPQLQDVPADKKISKAINETIKKVGEDIEKLSFNTAISAMMVLTNTLTAAEIRPARVMVDFARILSPFAPHVAEELYARLRDGFPALVPAGFVADCPWPQYDPAALVDDEVEIVLQVNGKLRDRITVAVGASKELLEAAALANERVKEFIAGVTVRKVIVVPGKIVNVVAN